MSIFLSNIISVPFIQQPLYLRYREEVVKVDHQWISKDGGESVILHCREGMDVGKLLRDWVRACREDILTQIWNNRKDESENNKGH